MKDADFGEGESLVAPRSPKQGCSLAKKAFTGGALILCFIVVVFGIGVVASHFEKSFHPESELLHAEHMVSEAAHELAIRGDCVEIGDTWDAAADAIAAKVAGSSGLATGISATPNGTLHDISTTGYAVTTLQIVTGPIWTAAAEKTTQSTDSQPVPEGVSVPVSTQTATTTIYSIWSSPKSTTHVTRTRTATTTLPALDSTVDVCSARPATKTVSVYVTVSPMSDKTVTAEASTMTAVNTDVSLTNGLPDITISARPSTRTAVQTDLSLTSGLPEVTVSDGPDTMTKVHTDVSLTSGLPDATVSGNPSTITTVKVSTSLPSASGQAVTTVTITDLWGPAHSSIESMQSMQTTTAAATTKKTVTVTKTSGAITITVSDLVPPPERETSKTSVSGSSSALGEVATASSSSSAVIVTETVTTLWTWTPSATSITTVRVPSGLNTTASATPYGTVTAMPPVVVSDGGKKPEPKGWGSIGGGGSGGGNLGCSIMLIAAIMFVL